MRALLKANAKENLRGNWGTAILVLLIAHVLLSASSMVVAVGELILLGPLETGVALVFLKLSYREPAEVGDLFQPFQNFVNTFFAGFLSAIFTFLWSLLFVIPGIVKAYAYSMVYYVKADHPEYGWRECLDESQRLMTGHKWEKFVLDLSFIGWGIVGSLCLGVGTLWVMTYMAATEAQYYEYLTSGRTSPEF